MTTFTVINSQLFRFLKSALRVVYVYGLFTLSNLAYSQSFVEGTHFSIIDDVSQGTPNNETVEYFSFSCPGCYAMEPHIQALKERLPSQTLRRVHTPFGGKNAKLSQVAFVLIELLNAEQHSQTVFERIHRQRNAFDSNEEIIDFFQSLGYKKDEIVSTMDSFAADTMLRKMNLETKRNRIRTVPTIIVNGKYQINAGAVYDGTNLVALVDYLQDLP